MNCTTENLRKELLVYTTSQRVLNSKIFNVFKEVSSVHQACIYLIKNTAKAVILWNIFTILNNSFLFEYNFKLIYFCDQSSIFSIITPVFSVTWSSEIIIICWFAAQETVLLLLLLLLSIIKTVEYIFSGFLDEQKDPKISIYLK